MTTIDQMFADARRRLYKNIERRAQLAQGRPQAKANRSAGQLFGQRGRWTKLNRETK